ncbi:MAG TPA: tetratricopeptide repeat protein, partial [Chitinophagaceae bacterium]|nr:tetratricopeptide repeat protein [Chitinophagaceae bacterium]
YVILTTGLLGIAAAANAQKADKYLYKGNELYRKQEFERSSELYKQALTADPKSPIANFNQGNALFRQQKFDDAKQSFDEVIQNTTDKGSKEQAYYNKGVAAIKQNKLEESIDAWKNALKLDPTDQEARENLQKALRELKKQQQQQNKKNKDQKKQQQQQKQQQDQQQQQPPPQSKLSKQRVEQLLKALQQKEKEVQDRLQKEKVASPRRPEKDW